MRQNNEPRDHKAHSEGHLTCSCGQELDFCTHEHCPRCGHRIVLERQLVGAGVS